MRVCAALRSRLFVQAFVLTVSLLCHATLHADSSSAALSVTVADTSGAVIPKATVVIRNAATDQQQTASTSQKGNATFSFLKPGQYGVVVQRDGFAEVAISEIVLNVGDERQIGRASCRERV